MEQKIPIVIVSGYLGVGKTTFIREAIKQLEGKKIAIIMNEFGEVAIDSEIIKGKYVNMVELAGGCVCCSLTGELQLAINEILEKVKPELILIETTGIAEPDTVIFNLSEMENVRLDLVITIVDADNLAKFEIGYVGKIQIESADIILLNKIDLIEKKVLEQLKEKIREINKNAYIFETVRGKIDLNILFGLEIKEKTIEKRIHDEKEHSIFDYFHFENDKIFSFEKFEEFLNNLPKEIIRVKGFIKTNKGNYFFNYVNGRYEFEEYECEKNKILFVGINIRNLEKYIKERLKIICEN